MAFSSVVLAPNAFKGTLSPLAAARAMAAGVERACPGRPVLLRPLPDGGDGTLDVLLAALGGERASAEVDDACGRRREVAFGLVDRRGGRTAIIESALVLSLAHGARCPFSERRTDGLGQLIRCALDRGARTIYVGLGGSATCDAGLGLLSALGLRFRGSRADIRLGGAQTAGPEGLDPRLRQTRLVALTDVFNILLGPKGASLFAPQKGADRAELEALEATLTRLADLLELRFGRRVRELPGSGAAGGLGFAFALLGARLVRGAPAIARLTGLYRAIAASGLVITGEGACDGQTAYGKGPQIVAAKARALGKPVILICGRIEPSFTPLAPLFSRCAPLMPAASSALALSLTVADILAAEGL